MTDYRPLAAESREVATMPSGSTGNTIIVDTRDRLDDIVSRIPAGAALGMDTEFVRERTFFPQPGLIQLSDGKTAWLIDPLAIDDFGAVGELLRKAGCIKVLHSAGEDLEMLRLVCNALPDPLFDTQIAAAMLGKSLQSRYEHLVSEMLGVELAGGQARSNWRQRPLPDGLIEYAAQDVIWLPALHARLADELERIGRLEWLEEDCARLLDAAREPEDPMQCLIRIKGAARLDDAALARLAGLARWRDEQARRKDLPRSFVLRDEGMLELARRAPSGTQDLAAIPGIPRRLLRRQGERLLELISSDAPESFQRPPELRLLDRDQRARLVALQHRVRELGTELNVDPALIASKRELIRLVQGLKPEWIDGWRGRLLVEVLS